MIYKEIYDYIIKVILWFIVYTHIIADKYTYVVNKEQH